MNPRFGAHAILTAFNFLAVLTACSIGSDVIVVHHQPPENDVIKGYQQWTRVNPEPVLMNPRVALMCAIPPPVKERVLGKENPHALNYITVYVNDLGTNAMMHEKTPRFPQGSVIVKEKLPRQPDTSPELLTVMVKREAGFNASNGDWEYMVFDGTGKEVQARGQLETCQGCHTTVKHNDFVYRSYLPSEARDKLK